MAGGIDAVDAAAAGALIWVETGKALSDAKGGSGLCGKKRSGLRVNPALRHPASTQATKWFASKATLSAGQVTTAVCPGVLSPWRQDLQDNTGDRLPTYQRWVDRPRCANLRRLRRFFKVASIVISLFVERPTTAPIKEAAQARSEYRERPIMPRRMELAAR